MKLIIREYLSSLRERGELDVILPDLLSQMGFNVYSRPGRGTRQYGVDVGAVGSVDGGEDRVYLFSIKPGNLTRQAWDSDSIQSLRQSLNEILDAYIPSRLPPEHQDKNIVICICIGGDVQEQVGDLLRTYISKNSNEKLKFEEWNGDKLASLIQENFLREDILPKAARSNLRKSLALLDEPDISHKHFVNLVISLSESEKLKDADHVVTIRQLSICLWILFAWGREAGNMESAYLSSEITLLHAWNITRDYIGKKKKAAKAIHLAFWTIFSAYQQICSEFLKTNVLPHVDKLHGLSTAVHPQCSLDVNLKLFDLLGRLGIDGIWAYWGMLQCSDEETERKQEILDEVRARINAIKAAIVNNPALFLPIRDDQAIDISVAAYLLALDPNSRKDISNWLSRMIDQASFAYKVDGKYPCNLDSYSKLLSHPENVQIEYKESVTAGSILYPIISILAALFDEDSLYENVSFIKQKMLQHCNFQYWYPDDSSEAHIYVDDELHGAALSNVPVNESKQELLNQVFGECNESPHFNELSAVKVNWWPLVIVACRCHRLPLPLHLFKRFYRQENAENAQ